MGLWAGKCRSTFLIIPLLGAWLFTSSVDAKDDPSLRTLLEHAGRSFSGVDDPSYLEYDLALRRVVAERIRGRFGVIVDLKTYSGFELLQIEALFRCRKSNEPFELFLRMVPTGR